MTTTPNILAHSPDTLADSATEGVISCTRAELGKLGDWCRRTTEVFIVAGAVAAGANNALGQTEPNTQQVAMLTPVSYTTNTRSQQQTATFTTTAVSSSPSATLQETNGYGQIVEFQGEKISVAEVQAKIGAMSPEERTKAIKEGMSRSDRLIFKTWEQEMITAEKEKALKITEVTINNIQAKSQVAEAANQNIQAKSQVAEAANQKIIREVTILVSRIEKNESLLKNNEIVKNLQEVYDKAEIFSINESLLSKIQALIIKSERYHDQFGG